jgi:phage-related protein
MGDSRQRVRFFPRPAQREAGQNLRRVQESKDPKDWKPMREVGPGVKEIRVHAEGEYRLLYLAKFKRAVYVLHAFAKKTRRTSPAAIQLAKSRYGEVLRREREKS